MASYCELKPSKLLSLHKVNVLYTAFSERNSPVWIVLARRGVDIECVGLFGITR